MNKKKEKELEKILKYDPLAEAEKDTGASYKESQFTMNIGLFNHLEHVQKKEEALFEADDTVLSNDLDRYLRIVQDIGFEKVLELPFAGHSSGGDRIYDERIFIFWRDGILLVFETYMEDGVNGGHFYYNWAPHNFKEAFHYTSSGSYVHDDPWIWAGDHDCREALRFHIRRLEENGTILPVWKGRPFLWLLNYMDTKDDNYDHDQINRERIAMLPKDIQKAIKGK